MSGHFAPKIIFVNLLMPALLLKVTILSRPLRFAQQWQPEIGQAVLLGC